MFSSSFRFVPVIRHDSLETQNKHKPDTSRSFLAKHLLNCLPASPPRMVSGSGARPTGRQPGGDGAIRGEHRRATSKEQRAFGTYAFLSRTPNKSPGALRISGPGQTDKLLSVVPEGRLTREGGSRLVTGRSSGFRVFLPPRPSRCDPKSSAVVFQLAAVVAGYSGASAADFHGLPYSARRQASNL